MYTSSVFIVDGKEVRDISEGNNYVLKHIDITGGVLAALRCLKLETSPAPD